MAKRELIPAKQEKGHERVKNFRAELLDYRQHFDRLKKGREESVRPPPPTPHAEKEKKHLQLPLTKPHPLPTAKLPKPQRAARPAPAPHLDAGKPVRALRARVNLALRTRREPRPVLRRLPAGLHARNARLARAVLHVADQRPAG